jgi:hypothetical protein
VVANFYDPTEGLSAHECSVTLFAATFNPNNPSQEALFAKVAKVAPSLSQVDSRVLVATGIRLRAC